MTNEVVAKNLYPGMRVILNGAEHEVQSVFPGERLIKVISTIEFSGMTRYISTTLDNHSNVTVLFPKKV